MTINIPHIHNQLKKEEVQVNIHHITTVNLATQDRDIAPTTLSLTAMQYHFRIKARTTN
jgi:hypothetical protein